VLILSSIKNLPALFYWLPGSLPGILPLLSKPPNTFAMKFFLLPIIFPLPGYVALNSIFVTRFPDLLLLLGSTARDSLHSPTTACGLFESTRDYLDLLATLSGCPRLSGPACSTQQLPMAGCSCPRAPYHYTTIIRDLYDRSGHPWLYGVQFFFPWLCLSLSLAVLMFLQEITGPVHPWFPP
jgi:hypothetical protein